VSWQVEAAAGEKAGLFYWGAWKAGRSTILSVTMILIQRRWIQA
jgi:hypothetical protein